MFLGGVALGAVLVAVPGWTRLGRVRLRLLAVAFGALLLTQGELLLLLLLLLLTQTGLAHLVALFVHEELALDALEALAAEAPDPVLAVLAEGSLKVKVSPSDLR
jgi:hypothetical protein